MRLDELHESASADIDSMMEGRAAWAKFTAWMHKHNETLPLARCGMTPWKSSAEDRWMLSTQTLGIDLPNAYIGIGWARGREIDERAYTTMAQGPEGRLAILVMLVDEDPRNKTDVVFGMSMSDFMHEWTHLVDYARGYTNHLDRVVRASPTQQRKWLGDKNTPAGRRSYYNRPIEFNGYYQQGLDTLINSLQMAARKSSVSFARTYLGSFDGFCLFAKAEFDDGWQRNLKNSNRQRLGKRLYMLFDLIRQQWPNLDVLQRIDRENEAAFARWKAENPEEAAEMEFA